MRAMCAVNVGVEEREAQIVDDVSLASPRFIFGLPISPMQTACHWNCNSVIGLSSALRITCSLSARGCLFLPRTCGSCRPSQHPTLECRVPQDIHSYDVPGCLKQGVADLQAACKPLICITNLRDSSHSGQQYISLREGAHAEPVWQHLV